MKPLKLTKHFIAAVAICASLLWIVGCAHTVIGGGGKECYSPPGGKYGRYHVGIESHGANAHAYIDQTKKQVLLWITSTSDANDVTPSFHQRLLIHFQGEYILNASDLGWDVRWIGRHKVEVTFFDYGAGISSYDAQKSGVKKHVIGRVQYAASTDGSVFHEVVRKLPSA